MKRYNKHIFICENERPNDDPRGCCAEKGSIKIREYFKTRLKELGSNALVRANSAGCLDACEFGVSIVVYPEQIWYGTVKKDDVDEIIESHILNDIPVERLKINHPRYNKDDHKEQ